MDTGNSESPVEQAKKSIKIRISLLIININCNLIVFRYYSMTGDIEGTLSRIPENRTREIIILKAINRHGVSEVIIMSCTCIYMYRYLYLHVCVLHVHTCMTYVGSR